MMIDKCRLTLLWHRTIRLEWICLMAGEKLRRCSCSKRRKSLLTWVSRSKRNASNSPPNSPVGTWPRSMFGTRPWVLDPSIAIGLLTLLRRSRTRARTASQADAGADNATSEDNAPPLASIYDTIVSDTTSNDTKATSDFVMTPTPVRVANFSDERFPDLVCALRRYYGPILEAYSGLPENESKFPDPEIIPRDQLDYATSKTVQPMSGKDGGPGPWVRITFRDREAAQRALEGSSKGELVVGGRTIIISPWVEDHIAVSDAGLPFSTTMDIDPPTLRRRSSVNPTPSLGGGSVFGEPTSSGNPAVDGSGVALSDHMPGARRVVPKRVEFAKKEGWISRWVNALLSATPRGGGTGPAARQGWGSSIGGWYRYIMDEVVGFKYL
jgi:hypothetical protein